MTSIVDYSSSDDNDDNDEPQLKRKASTEILNQTVKLPKLPCFFDVQQPPVPSDKHNNRVRTVAHTYDSWATYVYCKVDLSDELNALSGYLKDVECIEEQHISLSRPVYLRKYQLDQFAQEIKEALAHISSFSIAFAQLAPLTNDEKTRSFLTLEIGTGYNELQQCMKCVDKIMLQYHKPVFYHPPRFHTSIAWSLNQQQVESLSIPSSAIQHITHQTFFISKIYIKMGNRTEHISLA